MNIEVLKRYIKTVLYLIPLFILPAGCNAYLHPSMVAGMTPVQLRSISDANLCFAQRHRQNTNVASEIARRNLDCNAVAAAPQGKPAATGTNGQTTTGDIRSIDFKNFTYPLSPIAADDKKSESIKVRDGLYQKEWEEDIGGMGKSLQFMTFSVKSVSYGDLTGDGKEDAVVSTDSSWMGGVQQFDSHLYIYIIKADSASLLSAPDINEKIYRDYRNSNASNDPCYDGVWGYEDAKIIQGVLVVEAAVGDQRRCYKGEETTGFNGVTMKYRLNGTQWVLMESPRRWVKNNADPKESSTRP